MDVTFLLLHTNDIRRVIWFILIYLRVLVEREEAKLEEVLDDDCDLEGKKNCCQRSHQLCFITSRFCSESEETFL